MTEYKETVLFVGGDSVGKTTVLFEIAEAYPSAKFILIDFENKWNKVRNLYFPHVNNVEVISVLNWDEVEAAFTKAKKELGAGDWLLIDGLDKAWDIIQSTYDATKHGQNEWGWIKGKHNKDFLDVACTRAPFNVAATAYAQPNADFNIQRESDAAVKEELMMWKQIGFRPGGEKRNISRFDTVLALKAQLMPRKNLVTTFKDKGRPYLNGGKASLWMEFQFPLWKIYVDTVTAAAERGERVAPIKPIETSGE